MERTRALKNANKKTVSFAWTAISKTGLNAQADMRMDSQEQRGSWL